MYMGLTYLSKRLAHERNAFKRIYTETILKQPCVLARGNSINIMANIQSKLIIRRI